MEFQLLEFLFIFFYFINVILFSFLVSKIISIKKNWTNIYITSLIIASFGFIMNYTLEFSPMFFYIILLLLYIAHIFISYTGSIILKLSCSFIIMIYHLGINIIIWSIMSLITNSNIDYIIISSNVLLITRLIVLIISCITMCIILKTIKVKYLKLISTDTQRLNILFIFLLCLIMSSVFNTTFFTLEIVHKSFFIQQFVFGACILCSLCAALFMIMGYEIIADIKYFAKNLKKSIKNENLVATLEINCSNKTIVNYIYKGEAQDTIVGLQYNNFVDTISNISIFEEDKSKTKMATSLIYMNDMYKNNLRKYKSEYRVIENGVINWHYIYVSFKEHKGLLTAIITVENIQDEKGLIMQAERNAITKLYTQKTTETFISKFIKAQNGVLFIIEIDNFKALKNNLGSDISNDALKDIATNLNGLFFDADVIGHITDEEFAVYFKESMPNIDERALNLCQKITKTYSKDNINITISASVGIAEVTDDILDFDQLYNLADIAMYQSKKRGKNTFTIFENVYKKQLSLDI
ncbi:hypothetical protein AN641_02370 [Candidatus Epulonipiscioides gigas]|nr:hypothetical protein AN641_02370 [Epulopiscium sp. SCG-C07WGA-EpuloA2]